MTYMKHRPVRKVFIANRGEIARRIAEATKAMGLQSVAIIGRPVPPAFLAGYVDEFIYVAEERTATYLDQDLMIRLALAHGADALHPGFGFLSENAGFAAKVIAAGLTWIGPGPDAIAAMASKASARTYAEKAGVPCLPGLQGVDLVSSQTDLARVQAFARNTGYPLLIKAAMGGGGKGMRLVHAEEQLVENAMRASSEALSAFGDGSIIIEKYLPSPRHVEVQVLADAHGHVYAIGDRDCSLQRRHQKVLEEAPAPGLQAELRARMHAAAVALAQNVGYVSAGTVEFLLEERAGQQSFYFLEMNTRLQVEHPVTEEVYGIDLVQWQLRIAQGEVLSLKPERDLQPRGHSIEVRLYAEDVHANFFPSPGPVLAFKPYRQAHTRWEVGLDAVDRITPYFDPMVAKLIVHGKDRHEAFQRLRDTLERTLYVGPAANLEFLRYLCTRPAFVAQAVSTHYIQDELPSILDGMARERETYQALADQALARLHQHRQGSGGMVSQTSIATLTQEIYRGAAANAALSQGKDLIVLDEENLTGSAIPEARVRVGHGLMKDELGAWQHCQWAETQAEGHHHWHVQWHGILYSQSLSGRRERERSASMHDSTEVRSPVPGKVIKIQAEKGQDVAKNQVLVILESMKMEFEVQAPRAGRIAAIKVSPGAQVDADTVLIQWES